MKMLPILTLITFSYAAAYVDSNYGSFQIRTDIDPVTDINTSAAVTLDDSNVSLLFKCTKSGLTVQYDPSDFKQREDLNYVNVIYRFDKNKAVGPKKWSLATTNDAIFIASGELKTFIGAAVKSQSVTMRAIDYQGTPYTNTFPLTGLKTVLTRLKCAKNLGF